MVFVIGMEIVSRESGTMRAGDAVSRARCGILHAASQNRDPGFGLSKLDPGSAAHHAVKNGALRPGHETAKSHPN
jgi:hypothetical protein